MRDDTLAYAKEVWAACATLGYDGAEVRALKALIDRASVGPVPSGDLATLAEAVQRASVAWVASRRPR